MLQIYEWYQDENVFYQQGETSHFHRGVRPYPDETFSPILNGPKRKCLVAPTFI